MKKTKKELVLIGILSKPSGLKGKIIINSFLENAKRFKEFDKVFIGDKKIEYLIEEITFKKNKVVLKFHNLDNIKSVEEIIGKEIFIDKNQLPKLKKDNWYHYDIVGLEVKDKNDNNIGKVIALYNFGAGDIIEIKYISNKTEMFPFTKDFVKEIKNSEGYLIMEIEEK